MIRLFTALLLVTSSALSAQCSSTATFNAGGGSNNNALGSIGWSGMTNVITSNNGYCTAGSLLGVLSSANTQYLMVSNFGFSLPAGAAVCGIEVSVERNASGLLIGSSVTDYSVKIVKNGSVIGSEHASGANWGGSDATAVYGGNADAWGTSWTNADINNAGFGLAISAQMSSGLASLFLSANIDMIRITVYYSDITLPIELISFTGASKQNTVELEWATATETNNEHFALQKLYDTSWVQIATCAGAGTTTQTQTYSLYDTDPSEINYYRLVQYDYNGASAISHVIAVEHIANTTHQLRLFPQPVTDHVVISGEELIVQTDIYTNEGTLVQSSSFTDANTSAELNTSELKPGVYIIHVHLLNGDVVAHRLLII